jgi:hypothetical protein
MSNRARSKLAGNRSRSVYVIGENRRVQSVHCVVGYGDGVPFVVGRDHAQHRTEDLFLRDRRGIVDVSEDGRLEVPPSPKVLWTATASDEFSTISQALPDVAFYSVALTAHGKRTHLRRLIERVPYFCR